MSSVTLGLPINFFAVSSALGILGKTGKGSNNHTSWKLEYIVLGGLMMWTVVAFICGAIYPAIYGDNIGNKSISIVGNLCLVTTLLYYIAPLSVLLEIIKNKDAAGLYGPMIIMNLITSTAWAAYGYVFIGDVVIYSPNMFAMLISCLQLYLKLSYPSIDPTKLQRRMTIDYSNEGEDAKEPEPYRYRAGTITQDILCGDGTIAVVEFTEQEAVTRNRRSSTVTSIAERVLDVLDIIGPRRLPAEAAVELPFIRSGGSDDGSISTGSGTGSTTGGEGDFSFLRSPRGGRGRRRSVSGTAMPPAPMGMLPVITEDGAGSGSGGGVHSGDDSDHHSPTKDGYVRGLYDLERGAGGEEGVGHESPHTALLPEPPSTSLLQTITGAVQSAVRSRSSSRAPDFGGGPYYEAVDSHIDDGKA